MAVKKCLISHVHEQLAFGMLDCILGGNKVIYASTPITNGRRYLKWRSSLDRGILNDHSEYDNSFMINVFLPNCDDGKSFAESLRLRTGRIVVDPSCLCISDWTQVDYVSFWCNVIIKYADEVRFNCGWELSAGCTKEFEVAYKAGVVLKNHRDDIITLTDAISLVASAVAELKDAGIEFSALNSNLLNLISLGNARDSHV